MPNLFDDDLQWLETQIETRARFDSQNLNTAYDELAQSVSGPTSHRVSQPWGMDNADVALGECLSYYKTQPTHVPPKSVDDFEQRLGIICESANVMWRKVCLGPNWQKRAVGAMLGMLDTGERVALIPAGILGYKVVDPATGKRRRVTRRVAQHIGEEAYCFYRMLPAKKLTLADLLRFMAAILTVRDVVVMLAAALAVVLVGLLPAMANQILFGTVIPSGGTDLILPIAILLVGVAISETLVNICRNLVMEGISTRVGMGVEAAFMARVITLPTQFFKNYAAGNLARRVTSLTQLCLEILSLHLGSGLSLLLSVVYLVQINIYTPSLLLPAACIVLVDVVAITASTYANARYDSIALNADAKLSGLVTSLLNAINKIKLTGSEDRAFLKWADGYARYARASYNRPNLLRMLPALVGMVGLVGTVVIYYVAAITDVDVANFMSFNAAFGQLIGAVGVVSQIAPAIARIQPMLELTKPILEAVPEVGEAKALAKVSSGSFEISGVSFRYNESNPYVLQDFSLKVRGGEYVALVGPSGCGKSTILRLLLGFEKPERGAIYYDGQDISKLDVRSLRRSIGTVMQDGKLFLGDIQNNITVATPGAGEKEAWQAAELAGIADDIRHMPMGMHTLVTEGSGGLSGGQKQRLMIARAVCGNRKILMFDEATSALDNVIQQHVSDSLDGLACTRLVIAHRLSTVRHCDRIVVLNEGRIVEEGSYDELMAADGFFTGLVQRQQLDEA
ncbi:MAG: ATP-binding cassette domain-containing protein [Coriobacteriales bacterium]|nr:ATP-binding cassette domain-containing protein [Coriobacteriales bacterium]